MTDATSFKQRITALPIIGGLLVWCKGIVRMNAHRRQNAIDHAHFLALHSLLEQQLGDLRRQHQSLLESQQAHEANVSARLDALHGLVDQALRGHGELALELHHKLVHEQEQILALVTGHILPLQEGTQALRLQVEALDESVLQAEAGQDMLTDRVNGLSQAWRRQAADEKS